MTRETSNVATPGTSAYEIGERYEASLSDRDRRLGSHFTPADVAEALVARAWATHGHRGSDGPVVCDPSCGGGVFLVAAANLLLSLGYAPERIVNHHVVGVDIDQGAVRASAEALSLWAAEAGATSTVTPRVLLADGLVDPLDEVGAIDLVVGNPPFQNQLGADTARDAAQRALVTERFGSAAKGYVDVAALFLLRSLQLVRPGGTVCLIQPRSLLAARDAVMVRARVLDGNDLAAMWLPGVKVFEASVDVCAPIVTVGTVDDGAAAARTDPSTKVIGGRVAEVELGHVPRSALDAAPTWSPLWAVANGVPLVAGPGAAGEATHGAAFRPRSIGDLATATAGFRDQFYGIASNLVADEPDRGARVISTGMIDPLALGWSTRQSRIGGVAWTAPWVDLDAVARSDSDLQGWIARLLIPKVLVATQTRVIEVVEDPLGDLVPLTPVIAVTPAPGVSVSHLAAALLVPAATAWAAAHFGGAGLSHAALKLSAKQVLQLPVPCDEGAWDAAADMVRRGAPTTEDGWLQLASVLNASWGIEDPALDSWWVARVPQMSSRRRILR